MKLNQSIRPATAADKTAWDVQAQHPLQSWAWGEFRQTMGVDVTRLVTEKERRIIAVWQLTFHRIPYTPFTIGYLPKGPLPTSAMLETLTQLGKQKRSIFIQLEPNVAANSNFEFRISQFFRPSHHPLFSKYTFMLNLTKSEKELLSAMSHKTRYNIRLAQKSGVVVKEDNSPKAFAAYLNLTAQTLRRQRFWAHTQLYHQKMWKTLSRAGIAHLFTASLRGEILAAWIVLVWKDTLYYPYGASSREHRQVMAPNLLLWEVTRWAKTQGIKYFDLWGALGPNPDLNDPWYGFHRFKEGYAPMLVEFIGSYDLVLRPALYQLYTLADTLRWKLLQLTK